MSGLLAFLIFSGFALGLAVGITVGALTAGTANNELAQRNWKLDRENRRLRTQLNVVTEDVAS